MEASVDHKLKDSNVSRKRAKDDNQLHVRLRAERLAVAASMASEVASPMAEVLARVGIVMTEIARNGRSGEDGRSNRRSSALGY